MEVEAHFSCQDPACPGRDENGTCTFVARITIEETGNCDQKIIGPDCRHPVDPEHLAEAAARAAQQHACRIVIDRVNGQALGDYLLAQRWAICRAAQAVYDDWEQNENGHDEVYGGGGACDAIAEAITDVLDCAVRDGGWDGDEHAYLIVSDGQSAYSVDIPAHVYETGGGMRWEKRSGVVFTPADVVITDIGAEFAFGEDDEF